MRIKPLPRNLLIVGVVVGAGWYGSTHYLERKATVAPAQTVQPVQAAPEPQPVPQPTPAPVATAPAPVETPPAPPAPDAGVAAILKGKTK